MRRKISLFNKSKMEFRELFDSYQGWQAYAKWASTRKLRDKIKREIIDTIWDKIKFE